jgi:hypothetical protein
MAQEKDYSKLAQFYLLINPARYNEATAPFLKDPASWTKAEHPWGGEPHPNDELSLWSRRLHGSESLFRILYPSHPAGTAYIPFYSLMSLGNCRVPFGSDKGNFGLVTEVLAFCLEPYVKRGLGVRPCPVCLVKHRKDGPPSLQLYTPHQFVEHFNLVHIRHVHFIGLTFATDYSARLHEAYVLYNLVMASVAYTDNGAPILDVKDTSKKDESALRAGPLPAKWFHQDYFVEPFKGYYPEGPLEAPPEAVLTPQPPSSLPAPEPPMDPEQLRAQLLVDNGLSCLT